MATYKTREAFLTDLIGNEGIIFRDAYGREWKYRDGQFFFKDIGENAKFTQGANCLHLHGTEIIKQSD